MNKKKDSDPLLEALLRMPEVEWPKPKPKASEGVMEKIAPALAAGPVFLALIQDFSTHINNYPGAFTVHGVHSQFDDAEGRMMNAGQRHPGMVVEILESNGVTPTREHGVPPGLPEFAFALGDLVALAHAPSVFNFERVVIVAVSAETDAGAMNQARDILQSGSGLVILGRACSFGDAENGNYKSVFKKKDEPIIAGVC